MKTLLLYRDRDMDWEAPLPAQADALVADLGLIGLIGAMAKSDKIIPPIALKVLLTRLPDEASILYRQAILQDCLTHREVVRSMYALAGEAIENESRNFWGLRTKHASSILRRSREVLYMFFGILRKLRATAQSQASTFASEGFSRLFAMLQSELDDAYLAQVDRQLHAVEFEGGMLMTAQLGRGNRGSAYVLRDLSRRPRSWWDWLFERTEPGYLYRLHPRDESGIRALSELGDRGVNLVADAMAQSADHILAFFKALRAELAFYIGCVNLYETLVAKGEPVSFPLPRPAGAKALRAQGLYDVCLALASSERVVGNDADAIGKMMIVITGANQGGKSTFLRGLGIAQLMLQCGMFVAAERFEASLSDGVFTHYKREEDSEMESGKFDEELRRMSDLAERLTPNALILFNESFAATNDREGSEIARQITEALVDSGVRVAFVTHLFEFAHGLWESRRAETLFLRADRGTDGRRTFRLLAGEPLPTSYGEDIYGNVFG
jgi:DNA mismatch repair ATPase MutS